MKINKLKGFTLIELIMVVIIIGLIVAIIAPKFVNQIPRTKISTTKANINALRSALALYYQDYNGTWPATVATMVPTYLRKVPIEAVNNTNTVVTTRDNLGGWLYTSSNGTVDVNLAGNDANGDAYSGY